MRDFNGAAKALVQHAIVDQLATGTAIFSQQAVSGFSERIGRDGTLKCISFWSPLGRWPMPVRSHYMAASSSIEILPNSGIDAKQLFILLHGVGGTPESMLPLAHAVRAAFPASVVLIPAGFEPFDGGGDGRQWFSVTGVTEENRPERVARVLPVLEKMIQAAQARFGLLQSDTALAGFSQGAIMALEAVQAHDGLAGRVMAFSGRYAELPKTAPQFTTIHLLHGEADPVMTVDHVQAAHQRLGELHGDATIDIATGVGHVLHPALIEQSIVRLQTCVPLRSWEAALGLNQTPPDGTTVH